MSFVKNSRREHNLTFCILKMNFSDATSVARRKLDIDFKLNFEQIQTESWELLKIQKQNINV